MPPPARRGAGRGSATSAGFANALGAATAPAGREHVERREDRDRERGRRARAARRRSPALPPQEQRRGRAASRRRSRGSTCATPARRRARARRPSRSAAAASANRSRSVPSLVSTCSSCPLSGSTSHSVADRLERLLARVADLDRRRTSCLPARSQERSAASRAGRGSRRRRRRARAAARPRRRASAPRRAASRAVPSGSYPSPEREQQADEPGPALRRRQDALGARRRSRRARRGCRGRSRRGRGRASTPSATSALRRVAVPNAIDGDRSSTIHVTSTRSARWTRTCGSVVRAVTFQSISRTSSPGTYGRTCASSRPAAEQAPSGGRPRAARRPGGAIVSSSALSRPSGTGPGPGRPGRLRRLERHRVPRRSAAVTRRARPPELEPRLRRRPR